MTVIRSTHDKSRGTGGRRALLAIASTAAMLLAAAAPASAGAPASAQASCVAAITAYEATQLPPGAVGAEVSGLARSGAVLGTAMVSPLAKEHGSLEACVGGEE